MFHYSVYSEAHKDAMVKLLSEVFPRYDPPAVAVHLTSPEFAEFVRLLCPQVASDRLTYVARSTETREIAGVLLTVDAASPPPDGTDSLSSKFHPIFDILGQLDAEYRAGSPLAHGEGMHLFLLAVAPRFAGRGIAHQLVAHCLTHGAARNYRVAITEATNPTSQHVFRKMGFVERVRRSYAEHRFAGEACFASIAELGGPILMEKLLADSA